MISESVGVVVYYIILDCYREKKESSMFTVRKNLPSILFEFKLGHKG